MDFWADLKGWHKFLVVLAVIAVVVGLVWATGGSILGVLTGGTVEVSPASSTTSNASASTRAQSSEEGTAYIDGVKRLVEDVRSADKAFGELATTPEDAASRVTNFINAATSSYDKVLAVSPPSQFTDSHRALVSLLKNYRNAADLLARSMASGGEDAQAYEALDLLDGSDSLLMEWQRAVATDRSSAKP